MSASEPIKWDPQWAIGDNQCDSEHRELVDLANGVIEAVGRGNAEESSSSLLSFLERVSQHFDGEEERMRAEGYHDSLNHIEDHYRLLQKLVRFTGQCQRQLPASNELKDFLFHWMVVHFLADDMLFGGYLQKRRNPR